MATDARLKYHNQLAANVQLPDRDYKRSLTKEEMSLVHNAWMNDAPSWMHRDSLEKYERLMYEAQLRKDGKGKGKDGKSKGKDGKGKRGAEKPAKGQGKRQRNPGREAHDLKKSGFNTFCFKFIGSKAMLMCAVQHPSAFTTAKGLQRVLNDLEEAHESAEYANLVDNAKEKTEEETLLKRNRDTAVRKLMQGRADVKNDRDTQLAREFRDGIELGSITVYLVSTNSLSLHSLFPCLHLLSFFLFAFC